LIYVHDDLVGNESSATLVAVGDPDKYPLDTYTTDTVGVQLSVGTGADRRSIDAPVVVAGNVNGWNIVGDKGSLGTSDGELRTVLFSMERARGALAVDIGILLVLLALPATALAAAMVLFIAAWWKQTSTEPGILNPREKLDKE
jgi:hypothetical protein